MMVKEEINKLRKELENSIEKNDDYEKIYKISTDLDKLIIKYYKEIDC